MKAQSTDVRQEFTAGQEGFPASLLQAEPPPKRIYLRGDASLLFWPALAIVGARNATPYGLKAARHFARTAALRGLTVVSGGAIGCDQAAHRGALEAGGRTLAVLGCGADIVYPARAGELFAQILAEGGGIVSEAPWGSPPSRWGFRKRNRLIAALAQATLIVEAGLPSGTFSTADATLSQGKEVLVVPGAIFASESQGTNRLIAQGALPVVDDTSFELALKAVFGSGALLASSSGSPSDGQAEAGAFPLSSEYEDPILKTLSQCPTTPETLADVCGKSVIEVIRCLSSLELTGQVLRLRDGRYTLDFPAADR